MFGVCPADFDEAAADPDDVAGGPFFLGGAAVPEEGKEVLGGVFSVLMVEWGGGGVRLGDVPLDL